MGFSYVVFIVLIYVLSSPTLQDFQHEGMVKLIESFFSIYWDDPVIFLFKPISVVYSINWLAYVEPHPTPPSSEKNLMGERIDKEAA